jgi:Trypsin Inhibitor like cysteine rich domain.
MFVFIYLVITVISAKRCSPDKVFMECGPSCTSTCGKKNPICKDGCIDGCHCPDGATLSNGICVKNDHCPCYHNGEEFEHGMSAKMPGCKTW